MYVANDDLDINYYSKPDCVSFVHDIQARLAAVNP